MPLRGHLLTGAGARGRCRVLGAAQHEYSEDGGEQGQYGGDDQAEMQSVQEGLGQCAQHAGRVRTQVDPGDGADSAVLGDRPDLLDGPLCHSGVGEVAGQGVDGLGGQQGAGPDGLDGLGAQGDEGAQAAEGEARLVGLLAAVDVTEDAGGENEGGHGQDERVGDPGQLGGRGVERPLDGGQARRHRSLVFRGFPTSAADGKSRGGPAGSHHVRNPKPRCAEPAAFGTPLEE